MEPDFQSMTANVNLILGLDIAKSLRVIVAQNQNGGPLTQEQIKETRETAMVDLMPSILRASGISAQKLKETLGL